MLLLTLAIIDIIINLIAIVFGIIVLIDSKNWISLRLWK